MNAMKIKTLLVGILLFVLGGYSMFRSGKFVLETKVGAFTFNPFKFTWK